LWGTPIQRYTLQSERAGIGFEWKLSPSLLVSPAPNLALLQRFSSRVKIDGSQAEPVMSEFKWRQFEGEIILWAVRWYCRYGISYRDLEQMMGERAVAVDQASST